MTGKHWVELSVFHTSIFKWMFFTIYDKFKNTKYRQTTGWSSLKHFTNVPGNGSLHKYSLAKTKRFLIVQILLCQKSTSFHLKKQLTHYYYHSLLLLQYFAFQPRGNSNFYFEDGIQITFNLPDCLSLWDTAYNINQNA